MPLPGNQVIGSCSICGGDVEVPFIWGGVIPPVPTCTRCGAVKREEPALPVIPMEPTPTQPRYTITTGSNSQ